MSELDAVLREQIEQRYLANQELVKMSLDEKDCPTGDQILMGIGRVDAELTFEERDYLLRSMVFRLIQLKDKPKVLYEDAFDKFLQFLFDKCSSVEVYIMMYSHLKYHKVRIEPTERYTYFVNVIKEVVDDSVLGL